MNFPFTFEWCKDCSITQICLNKLCLIKTPWRRRQRRRPGHLWHPKVAMWLGHGVSTVASFTTSGMEEEEIALICYVRRRKME